MTHQQVKDLAIRKKLSDRLILALVSLTLCFSALMLTCAAFGADAPEPLPDPEGKPADMSKPVQVYILMGQSNMVGAGKVKGNKDGTLEYAVQKKDKYPYLVNDEGGWTTRKDVRYARVMSSGTGNMRQFNNEWLSIEGDNKIGPEFGIGHYVGHATDAPVLILKSCIGNRSLGWDLLPPGSERYTVDGVTYTGYKDHPTAEVLPYSGWKYPGRPVKWYAGMQYDGDVRNAKSVLENLEKYYPGAKDYEVAGFFWWQGDKDRYDSVLSSRYEKNLVQLIKALRKDFNAPEAKFVIATLGQTKKDSGGNEGKIIDAMFNVANPDKYPQFKGDVETVYTHPLSMGSSSNAHYGGNAETYMNVGEAMGQAMIELEDKE